MIRRALVLCSALMLAAPALAATPGEALVTAVKKKDVKASAKLLGKGWKYGANGKDAEPGAPLEKFLSVLFKGFAKTFADSPVESMDCSSAARELAYMAEQWGQDDPSAADWLRHLPEAFCVDPTAQPAFWMTKRLDTDRPHAVVVVESAGDSPSVIAFYHF